MLIQIYIKNEPLARCEVLIAKEDASVSIPVSELPAFSETVKAGSLDIVVVKPTENMGMRAAIEIAAAIRKLHSEGATVQVQCPDKPILDGICSMEYVDADGNAVKCVPAGTKPPAPSRSRATPSKSPARRQDGPKPKQEPDPRPAPEPAGSVDDAPDPEPGGGESYSDLVNDPQFASGNDADVKPAEEPVKERDVVMENTPKVMEIMREAGVPSGQVPGVLEALREAMDASITFPMQVKLKLARDKATDDMDPARTAELVQPRFDELKKLLDEIDAANAAKAGG